MANQTREISFSLCRNHVKDMRKYEAILSRPPTVSVDPAHAAGHRKGGS